MKHLHTFSPLIGRMFISLIFIVAGYGKITAYSGTVGYMESMGIPRILLPLVILTELGGGLAILLGFQTRLVAFLMAGFCVLSALIFHFDLSDQMQSVMFMKNIAIAGGFLFLVANGPGAYALDNKRSA
jgi:putative oxidoreductase